MSLSQALTAHAELCDDLYKLMLDENRHLKASDRPPDEALLNQKRTLLASLTLSLDTVTGRAGDRGIPTPELRGAMEKVQQIILKALLLDRENEQLLLKTTLHPKPATWVGSARSNASQLQRTYGKFL